MRPLERFTDNPDYVIRPYSSKDREVIRKICCETGFLGEPIDSIFSDRDLFADYLTRYYTDVEPETVWVGEKNGEVVSYLLGCQRWKLNRWWQIWNGVRLAIKATTRFVVGKYDAKDRKFLKWILVSGWRETPWAPTNAAHLHFNSLKGHRKMGIARDLVVTLIAQLRKNKIPRVFGQMVTYENRRTEKVWEYMGWKVVDKKKVTKYEGKLDKIPYLTTVVMELGEENTCL
jgi:hypothetical protein